MRVFVLVIAAVWLVACHSATAPASLPETPVHAPTPTASVPEPPAPEPSATPQPPAPTPPTTPAPPPESPATTPPPSEPPPPVEPPIAVDVATTAQAAWFGAPALPPTFEVQWYTNHLVIGPLGQVTPAMRTSSSAVVRSETYTISIDGDRWTFRGLPGEAYGTLKRQ